ncbi:DEAD/DEAH box helicase [Benzoatithermus flavus]|uniref:DEAD/DEAH box helicase n=1 Tax=Benzoatithermus flavus TaxID=3108223 RepID=A0ABU8XKH3_9PROT
MSHRFALTVTPAATELALLGPTGPVPTDLWAVAAPPALLPGVDLVQRLAAAGSAVAEGATARLEHAAVARLTAREAALLGLPPLAEAVAVIETRGVINRPDFTASLRWQRPSGQPIVGAERTGAWLRIGEAWRRLPDTLLAIAEAVDRLQATAADDLAERMRTLAALREALPPAQATGAASAQGALGTLTIAIADAFSLDLVGEGRAARLVPILHRADAEEDAPLLPPEKQRIFGDDQFNRFTGVRPLYALGDGWYVVLEPPLQRALGEVRRLQGAPLAKKRRLLEAPRAFLREALGDEVESAVLERVFRETASYGSRVLGLGLWQPRVLPWVQMAGTDWFGPETGGTAGGPAPKPGGLVVGDRRIELDPAAAEELRQQVEDAIGAGRPSVPYEVDGETVHVPANGDTLAAFRDLAAARGERQPSPRPERTVLLIAPNEEEVEVAGEFRLRPAPEPSIPRCLRTPLKAHQREGLRWLQEAYTAGRPGVLLADDMGLGKTLQGLAFLAWLREAMTAGKIERMPLLIVAPTGLLENWRAEHDRHLAASGLGRCVAAYGRHLAAIRARGEDDRPSLSTKALAEADWVLTTYETLRDYDRDFGAVRFGVLLFDEAQKIKTPGVRLTDAAKAMNADFCVAMTGTPVENRLADLWCIVDTVHPAHLGDLRSFSATYEREPDTERLKWLKSRLDRRRGRIPPLLLRRLKEDELPDLPACRIAVSELAMPPAQAAAYAAVVDGARAAARRGAVLEALQKLRAVCLHPDPEAAVDDAAFVAASARLVLAMRALDAIAARGERALVFLDDLDLQARLAGLIQRRYDLPAPPMIINGGVGGGTRQARVDRFQAGPDGFDVMILSPRAGGVGLTLTRANHVVHLSRWWNPAVEDQCNGRVLRIGQTRPVTIHLPLAVRPDGRPSFDQNLHALLERKRWLMREALLPPAADERDREELLARTVDAA